MSRRALRERERAQSQPAEPIDTTPPAPSYRVRDYSPDARGAQFSTVGGAVPDSFVPEQATVPAQPQSQAQTPVAEPPSEHALTRRELRELRDAAERAANPEPHPVVEPVESFAQPAAQQQPPTPPVAQPVAPQVPPVAQPVVPQAPPELIEPLEPRPQEFVAPPPAQAEQLQSLQAQSLQAPSLLNAPAPDWSTREPEPAPDVVIVTPEAYAPPAPEFELAPDYAASVAPPVAPAAPIAVPPAPQTSVAAAPASDAAFARPEGHWSRQGDLDARTQLDDVLPSRDLSQSDAITTSALVLPSMPTNPIGALSSTGEILVTGSIDLPRMLGATGVHPARFDHAEFDSIIEAGDREDSHPSSAPVRAIRAVSTHTSTQGIIAAKRPRSKVPTYVLAGVATIMGVGVIVLFVGGMLLDLF